MFTDASFMNAPADLEVLPSERHTGTVDKYVATVKIDAQAGYIMLIGEAKQFEEHGRGRVDDVGPRMRKLKRRVRSTLAAETAPTNEGIKTTGLVRAQIVELWGRSPLNKNHWGEEVKRVPMCVWLQTVARCSTIATREGRPPILGGCCWIKR